MTVAGNRFRVVLSIRSNCVLQVPLLAALSLVALPVFAQPVALSPTQLDQLVSRIALYPDPLLAQILTASTYWSEIPEAARWSHEHSYLTGQQLAKSIEDDRLPWDPSVVALRPFPSVLDMMARDPVWTQQLGGAVLTQPAEVMDAVQRMRRKAMEYGYLRPNGYVTVASNAGYVEILPGHPGVIFVPRYDPLVVFAPPRAGLVVGGAIRFGPGITIGASFAPWGWASPGFLWPRHSVVIDRHPWERRWNNRKVYIHPYARPWVRPVGPRVERHHL